MAVQQAVNSTGIRTIDELRCAILAGEWEPGEKLPPAALAERFRTSTTVVREALTRLSGADLVVAKPNRGFFVRDLTLRELSDITELRCTTEALALRLSLERGDVQWESDVIATHHQLVRTPRRRRDDPTHISEDWASAHRRFHLALLGACDCEPMIRLASNLADSTELYRRWAAPSAAATVRNVEEEHRLILEAVLARDCDRAAELLRSHYEATVQVVLQSGLDRTGASKSTTG